MSESIDRPIFKRGDSVYIEKLNSKGAAVKTDIFKVRDDSIIEVFPPISENNIKVSFKHGEDVMLYYWSEGIRYYCKTMIVEYLISDQVYSIVLPKKMNCDDVRRWHRYDIAVPIVFLKPMDKKVNEDSLISSSRFFDGFTKNLSGGGALVVSSKKVNSDDLYSVCFEVAGEVCVFDCKIIKSSISEIPSLGFDIIIEFLYFNDAVKEKLDSLLVNHLNM